MPQKRRECMLRSRPSRAPDQAASQRSTSSTGYLRLLLLVTLLLVVLPTYQASADLIHNSVGTGSGTAKWPNGWGITGGQYGQFVCATCHEPDAGNLKNIRSTLSTMTSTMKWPNGQRSVTVVFQNQSSMGNDRAKHNKSNRICE